jgi:hypothetical protein
MSVTETLRGRWKDNTARFDKHALGLATRKHVHETLFLHDTIELRRAEIGANRSLSAIGQTDALRKVASAEAATLAKAQRALAAGRASVQQARRALTPTVANRTDAASAALRAEVRASLKGMERSKIATICDDPATDDLILESLFEGPTILTGIEPAARAQLLEIVVARRHGPAVEALSEQSDALDLLEASVTVAAATLQKAAGVSPAAFREWLANAAPMDAKEIEAEAAKFNADVTAAAAKALPLAARLSLVDSLLATNTAEVKAAAA